MRRSPNRSQTHLCESPHRCRGDHNYGWLRRGGPFNGNDLLTPRTPGNPPRSASWLPALNGISASRQGRGGRKGLESEESPLAPRPCDFFEIPQLRGKAPAWPEVVVGGRTGKNPIPEMAGNL